MHHAFANPETRTELMVGWLVPAVLTGKMSRRGAARGANHGAALGKNDRSGMTSSRNLGVNVLPSCLSAALFLAALAMHPAKADTVHPSSDAQLPPAPLALSPDGRLDAFQDSVRLYGRRAQAGEIRAQYLFGYLYEFGLGVSRDPVEAARWYAAAAEGGAREAQFRLGLLYLTGEGGERDSRRAAELFQKAADQGLAAAQLNLAILLDSETDEADPVAAARWYRAAALQGSAKAQNNLGLLYVTGRGVGADVREGMRWLALAARQGSPDALLNLARIYADGIGVPRDTVKAYALLSRVPADGPEEEVIAMAARARDALAQDLTASQRDEALRLADNPELLAVSPSGD